MMATQRHSGPDWCNIQVQNLKKEEKGFGRDFEGYKKMALVVLIKNAVNLRGRYDRIARISFRGEFVDIFDSVHYISIYRLHASGLYYLVFMISHSNII